MNASKFVRKIKSLDYILGALKVKRCGIENRTIIMVKSFLMWLNSDPILYDGRNFKLVYFGLFTSIGVFFAVASFTSYVNFYGFFPHYPMILWTTFALFCMLLFSKLFEVFVTGKDFLKNPIQYLRQTSFYNQGGQLGFLFALAIMALVEDTHLLLLLDGVCFGGAVASFFGRIGCYNYGCCYGRVTNSSFSITYYNMKSKILRFHPEYLGKKLYPTQLIYSAYDLIMYLSIWLIIYYKLNYKMGIITIYFVICYNIFRYLTQSLRADESKTFPASKADHKIYIYFALVLTFLGILVALYFIYHHTSVPELHPPFSFTITYFLSHTFLNLNNFLASLVPAIMVFIVHSYHKELGKHF